ncbi:hypothetical protein [Psychrobacter sp. I-STPA6b]|uniref:hypothetical protein n=1 Tax=Psychrobacter sp. I-STPA6b TaxID=2585718 RepID=UPI001D0C423B|nr:hypothetical protein [Psychrobacter sp. I-STPA6b]
MSIEYDAVFGIGFELDTNKHDEEELDSLLYGNEDYEYATSGNYYSGNDIKSYVFIRKDFAEIVTHLNDEKARLEQFLQSLGVETVGEFGLHGGCYVG